MRIALVFGWQLVSLNLITTMKLRSILSAVFLLTLMACLGLPPRPTSVKFFDADNKLVGFVDLIEIKQGIRFRVHTMGLPGGVRGFNLYASPTCEPPGFTTTGPLFTGPEGSRDSIVAGDLPDITVGTTEWADTTFDWGHLQLDKGDRGVFRNGGSALIITELPDGGSASSGAGGKRLACGVVKERPEER
jgi:Cu-Zn family superoxide dismutase